MKGDFHIGEKLCIILGMDKKLVNNYLYNVLYQIFVLITPFITVPYVTRTLGATVAGINDWTAGNVQWFVLIGQLGVAIYGNKTIAQNRDDVNLRSKIFWEIFAMQLISMGLSLLAYIVFIYVGNAPQYRLYAAIQAISLISVSLDVTWLFYGMEDFKKASLRNVIIKILSIFCIFAFIKKPEDLPWFIFINATSGVIGQCWMWLQVKEYIHFEKINWQGIVRHFKPNFLLFVPQIATSIYTMLDVSMLGYLYANKAHVSFYQQAQRFIKMFLFFITSIGTVMLPRVANLHQKGENDAIFDYIKITLQMAVYLSLPMIAGMCCMIGSFIGWFFDAEYALVTPLIQITSPIIFFISLSNVYGTQYLLPIGQTKIYTRSVVSGAVCNAVLNALLMPRFGAFGAVIASVCAEFIVTLTQWSYIHKHTKIRLKSEWFVKYGSVSVLMGLVVYGLSNALPYNIGSNIISVGCGCIVYFVTLVLIKDEFTLKLLAKVKGMVKRG